jgi:hypothetical protein
VDETATLQSSSNNLGEKLVSWGCNGSTHFHEQLPFLFNCSPSEPLCGFLDFVCGRATLCREPLICWYGYQQRIWVLSNDLTKESPILSGDGLKQLLGREHLDTALSLDTTPQ